MAHTCSQLICLLHHTHLPFCTGVALGKCVEYGYEFASDIAKRVATSGSKVKEPARV